MKAKEYREIQAVLRKIEKRGKGVPVWLQTRVRDIFATPSGDDRDQKITSLSTWLYIQEDDASVDWETSKLYRKLKGPLFSLKGK